MINNFTYFSLTVKHDLDVVAISHPELLAEDSDLAVGTISNEDWAFCRSDHDLWILTLVDEALGDMLMHVQLAIVTVVDLEVFAVDFTRRSIYKLILLLSEEKLPVGCPLSGSICSIPRMSFLLSCSTSSSAGDIDSLLERLAWGIMVGHIFFVIFSILAGSFLDFLSILAGWSAPFQFI